MSTPGNDVLAYWFGTGTTDAEIVAEKAGLWFRKSDEVDNEIRERFGPYVEAARSGRLEDWTETPCGALALVIVCDQFPRNIYRGSGDAFALDARARALTRRLLDTNTHRELRRIERVFVYLPLEHSETLADQDECVALYEALAAEAAADGAEGFAGYVDYAVRHRDIIARFGRFPHRNAALGRESTDEEREFLTQPGSSF